MLGQGRAKALTAADMRNLAVRLGCHPADLEAIAQVESNGFGWFPDGRMKILFEKHWFYKQLEGAVRTKAVKAGLARKSWISPAKGGYKDQATAEARYALLARAIKVDEEGAFNSISMGRFQIMGFNHELCGFLTAKAMWEAFLDSEQNQLQAFAEFLVGKGLVKALQTRDFARVEEVYNGGGLNGVYAKKMKAASDKLRAGKWADYDPRPEAQIADPVPVAPVKRSGWEVLIALLGKIFNGKG